jgi:hypothetical protein
MPRPLYFMVNLIMGGFNFEHVLVHTGFCRIFRVADPDPHYFRKWILIRIRVKSWIQTRMKVKIQEP